MRPDLPATASRQERHATRRERFALPPQRGRFFAALRACPKSEVRPSYGNKVGRADFVPITRIVVRNSLRHRMLSGHQGGNEREKPLRVFSLSSRSNLAFRTGSQNDRVRRMLATRPRSTSAESATRPDLSAAFPPETPRVPAYARFFDALHSRPLPSPIKTGTIAG